MVKSKFSTSRKGKEPASEAEWFLTPDHQRNWHGCFSKRSLAPERSIDFQSFRHELRLEPKFVDQGWLYALNTDTKASVKMVRLFYCNGLFDKSNWKLVSKVYGRTVEVDLESISLITNFPNDGFFREIHSVASLQEAVSKDVLTEELCGKQVSWRANIPTNQLKPFYRVIFQISTHNLVPKLGHKDEVSPLCAYIMFCLGTGVKINLCKFLMFYISQFFVPSHSSLPFGGLITAILENHQFVLQKDEELVKVPKPLGASSLKKMNIFSDIIGPSPPKKKQRIEEGTSVEPISNEVLLQAVQSLQASVDKLHKKVDRMVFGLSAFGLDIPSESEEDVAPGDHGSSSPHDAFSD